MNSSVDVFGAALAALAVPAAHAQQVAIESPAASRARRNFNPPCVPIPSPAGELM
jgi:hypothetical protein